MANVILILLLFLFFFPSLFNLIFPLLPVMRPKTKQEYTLYIRIKQRSLLQYIRDYTASTLTRFLLHNFDSDYLRPYLPTSMQSPIINLKTKIVTNYDKQ